MSKKSFLGWSILLFIFIYAPPVLPYPHILLGILVFIYMLLNYRYDYKEAIVKSDMNIWIKTMVLVFLYAALIPFPLSIFYDDVVNVEHYYHLFNRFAVLIFMEAICGTFLLAKFKRNEYTLKNLLDVLIGIAVFQSFLGCLAFTIPSVKEFFLTLMVKMGGFSTENEGVVLYRTFGFAGSMLDQFGYGTGIIAGISFFLGVNYRFRYLLFSLIVIIAAILNARSGIVIYGIGIFLSLFFALVYERKIKSTLRAILFIALIPMISLTTLKIIQGYNESTGRWISKGFESVIEYFTNGTSDQDNMRIITSDNFWELPDGPNIILGTAHSRYEAEGYAHTDNGIVNDIWFVGIIGTMMMYGVVVLLCYRIYRDAATFLEKYISIFLIVSFFIFDIKAVSIGYNMGGAVNFLILFMTRFYQKGYVKELPK